MMTISGSFFLDFELGIFKEKEYWSYWLSFYNFLSKFVNEILVRFNNKVVFETFGPNFSIEPCQYHVLI